MSVGQRRPGAPYHFDFVVGGRRFHTTTTTTNRREALELERQARQEAKREFAESRANAGRVSLQFGHVAAAYWEQVGVHHAGSEDTRRLLNLLIKRLGPTTLITAITDADVASLVAWRRGHKVPNTERLISPYTVNDTTEALKKLFTFCKGQAAWKADLRHMPNWKVHWVKGERGREKELSENDAERLAEAVRDDFKPLFDFILASGVRKTEARELRWSSVDWGNRQIITTGKRGERVIVGITDVIHDILWPLQGHHDEFVFTMIAARSRDGKAGGQRYPITHSGLNTRWRRDKRKAGLADLRVHDLRHDFASKLLRDCGDITIVRDALNHKSVRTTERYAHVLREDVTTAIDRMQQSKLRKKSTAKLTAKSAETK